MGDQAPTETKEFDPREAQLMVIEQEDTWKELRERLRKAPIISDILDGTQRARKRINETSAAKRVKDLGEDAREFWETSQNPLVYQASSIWTLLLPKPTRRRRRENYDGSTRTSA